MPAPQLKGKQPPDLLVNTRGFRCGMIFRMQRFYFERTGSKIKYAGSPLREFIFSPSARLSPIAVSLW